MKRPANSELVRYEAEHSDSDYADVSQSIPFPLFVAKVGDSAKGDEVERASSIDDEQLQLCGIGEIGRLRNSTL